MMPPGITVDKGGPPPGLRWMTTGHNVVGKLGAEVVMKRLGALPAVVFVASFFSLLQAPTVPAPFEERVRQSALQIYIHGMTDEIAQREVGPQGVPALLRLLDDASFPRRDNVVAFLTYLGAGESTPRL